MKNNLFKLFFLIVLIFLLLNKISAQLYSEINSGLVKDRMDMYKDHKMACLKDLLDGIDDETMIKIDKDKYFDMIRVLATGGYSGFRVYFAEILHFSNPSNNLKNHITLVFVPTKTTNNKKHQDDTSFYYYFKYDSNGNANLQQTMTADDRKGVRKEIKAYQLTRIPALEKNASEDEDIDLSDFRETKSLWYNIKVLNYNQDGYLGLWEFMKHNNLKDVNLNFVARTLNEQFEYHLDIVTRLEFEDKTNPKNNLGIKYFGNNGFRSNNLIDTLLVTYDSLKYNFTNLNFDYRKFSKNRNEEYKLLEDNLKILDKILRQIKVSKESFTDTSNPCPTTKCP